MSQPARHPAGHDAVCSKQPSNVTVTITLSKVPVIVAVPVLLVKATQAQHIQGAGADVIASCTQKCYCAAGYRHLLSMPVPSLVPFVPTKVTQVITINGEAAGAGFQELRYQFKAQFCQFRSTKSGLKRY